jgi:hypothetical protein
MSERKAGDICETCLPRWKHRKVPGKKLVELPTPTELGLKVVVCPYCDGSVIVAFANKPDNKFIPEPEPDEDE